MLTEQFIVTLERLRDDLGTLRALLRSRLSGPDSQVTATDLQQRARALADIWLTELSIQPEVAQVIASDYLADLNVHFQRLLTFAEHSTQRKRYEAEIKSILSDFTLRLVIPLKRVVRGQVRAPTPALSTQPPRQRFEPTAFVGHSFSPTDKPLVECVVSTLESIGVTVATGQKPQARKISEKVKRLIEAHHMFVGVFTRRDKIVGKHKWTTSTWVIDEKAYAYGKRKPLILVKEEGVDSIGGIQGDYEFIEFTRDRLDVLANKILQLFDLKVAALR